MEVGIAGAPLHMDLITKTAESNSRCLSLPLASLGLFFIREVRRQSALRSQLASRLKSS